MKRDVASQVIGAQMVDAADGSAFTGSVTCYVTGDGGTQAAGSVGSGACTHEGNGFHTYAPAQAETNYAHIAFTFVGTGAVPASVQVYTTFPQTGDSFARIGANGAGLTALASESALTALAGVFSGITSLAQWLGLIAGKQTGNSTARTEIRATGAGSGTFDETTDSVEALRDRGDAAWTTATGFSTLDAAGVRSAIGLANADLDTQIGTLATDSALNTLDGKVDDVKAKTDQLTFTNTGHVDANIKRVADSEITGGGVAGSDEWRPA